MARAQSRARAGEVPYGRRRLLAGGVLLTMAVAHVPADVGRKRVEYLPTPDALVVSAGGAVAARAGSPAAEEPVVVAEATQGGASEEGASGSDHERVCQNFIGTWEDDYHGHREVTFQPDGTGNMVVEPSGPGRLLFGTRLEFWMKWTVESGVLKLHTVGGEPAGKVRTVTRLFGDRAEQTILEWGPERVRLQDVGGTQEYEWRRVLKGDQ